ncbi:hypothetical protein IB277_31045 [Ensifer sp. ENS07]|nr:hypothetical protein [Ensifer sp. ENS07]MBD9640736.1 hypothetical protein [Ensifer sp. ENS07]
MPAREIAANPVPFSRSGGRTINGLERTIRTDCGFWSIALNGVMLHSKAQRRVWNALRTGLGGRSGLIVIPAWSWDTAPYASGEFEPDVYVPHSDGTSFSDGTMYRQGSISVRCAEDVPIGATKIRLQVLEAENDLAGVRFSFNHALYETGPAVSITGSTWEVGLFPAVRAPIRANADLEFNRPTCLAHLQDDRGMDVSMNPSMISEHSVNFVEAVDYWSDLAAGLLA